MRGRAPFFGAALFCALLTLCARSTREFRCATLLRELLLASTSARTQLASCPRKSRCVTLPCELLWRISVSEPTLRSCRGSVDAVACDPVSAPVPQISLAQALDVRLTCGFVPRLTSMLRSIRRGGGASRPVRRVQAGLGEEREPACRLRPQHVCLHLAHPSMYVPPLPPVRLPAIATMSRLHAQDVAPLSRVHSTACTKRSSDSCGTRAMARQ